MTTIIMAEGMVKRLNQPIQAMSDTFEIINGKAAHASANTMINKCNTLNILVNPSQFNMTVVF